MSVLGIDTGGTFTDVVVIDDVGAIAVGKAFSTPARPAVGVMAAIDDAARAAGTDRRALLAATTVLAHGTTVGVNALLTQTGARVGLLTTAGFEDTMAIARLHKTIGIDEDAMLDVFRWSKPPPLMPRRCVQGIVERVDRWGEVLVPLDEPSAMEALAIFREEGVDAVAICLLWGFANPVHEERLAELVAQELPGAHVTLASQLAPRLGEYERMASTALNAYVGPVVTGYLADLESELRGDGFDGSLLVAQSSGGVQRVDRVAKRPLETLWSGPVGGLGAAATMGAALGHPNVITSDVGGTSFDVGLIVDGELQLARRPVIGPYAIASPVVDVESIGTGGGSIAGVDPYSGALRVGPRSAGADPGPACYGRGGSEPTLTDAAVVLGYLDRLGSKLHLDADAAAKALRISVAEPLGMELHEAAEAVVRVATSQMSDLVRRVTVQRGHDPRHFALYAFGGAAPQYAGRYAAELGVSEVVVPANAAVFSAYGAAVSDPRTWAELELPAPFPPAIGWVGDTLARLERQVRDDLAGVGDVGAAVVRRTATLRFRRQVHALRVPLPEGSIDDAELERLAQRFHDEYDRVFGPGTGFAEAGIEFVGLRVEGRVPTPAPLPTRAAAVGRAPVRARRAWFAGGWVECSVYDGQTLSPAVSVDGPAFIELPTTCAVIAPGHTACIDDRGNIVIAVGRP